MLSCFRQNNNNEKKNSSISIPSHQVFSSSDASDCNGQAIAMKTNHFKMLLNKFCTTYTYSNCIVYRLFYC